MIFGYVRVSTADQTAEGQRSLIARYVVDHKLIVDEWIEVEMSSRKSVEQRRLTELLGKVSGEDTIIISELSRLGRSIREVLSLIEELINDKKCRLILIKQGLDINPKNHRDMTTKVLLTVFSMMAELERDFVSERTKEGLRARKERGIILGKPKGVIQASIYDKDKERIIHLRSLGVPITAIINTHLKYGKYLSLKKYIDRQKPSPFSLITV
ncbi:recombinase family protein [Spirosoma endbachense]|uniref:Resolvase n=1 Tax=Spirosoma endbachense TaxID=2666025 RepID=A0A6P1W1L3_9BACT|nr:recombinase family protein [Spirosoma endbachense]QHV99303.1 resolvase [Spirosoma endbachense]